MKHESDYGHQGYTTELHPYIPRKDDPEKKESKLEKEINNAILYNKCIVK